MKITYEVTEKGYRILNNGTPWIIQEGYFPYEGKDYKESAELHIKAIMDAMERPSPLAVETRVQQLEEENLALKMAMIEQDMMNQTELEFLKMAIIEQDMQIEFLRGGN